MGGADMDRVNDLLARGLTGAARRHEAIAGNIANVNTPRYPRQDVEFLELLRREFRAGTSLGLRLTEAGHLAPVKPGAQAGQRLFMRNDGNAVDLEYEMNQLAGNALYFNALSRQLQSSLGRLRVAITEGRR